MEYVRVLNFHTESVVMAQVVVVVEEAEVAAVAVVVMAAEAMEAADRGMRKPRY